VKVILLQLNLLSPNPELRTSLSMYTRAMIVTSFSILVEIIIFLQKLANVSFEGISTINGSVDLSLKI
jgi:hypothetical protein